MRSRVPIVVVVVVALAAAVRCGLRTPGGEPSAPSALASATASSAPPPHGAGSVSAAHATPPARPPAEHAEVSPTGLPMTLPDTPAMEAWLARQASPEARQMQEYLLGLYAHLDVCMAGAVPRGEIQFWLRWTFNDGDVARASYQPDFAARPTGFDDAAHDRFERCMSDYLAGHEAGFLGHGEGREALWGMAISFPIADQEIYRVIADPAQVPQAR
jgi:hypothetical protein